MNTAVERMWKARKKMCIGYDNAMGMLMMGWRIIRKSHFQESGNTITSLVIQSLDKNEWKRLYTPTFEKLRRTDVLEFLDSVESKNGSVVSDIYGLKKGV